MDIRNNQFRMISIFCLGKLVYEVGYLRINLFSKKLKRKKYNLKELHMIVTMLRLCIE